MRIHYKSNYDIFDLYTLIIYGPCIVVGLLIYFCFLNSSFTVLIRVVSSCLANLLPRRFYSRTDTSISERVSQQPILSRFNFVNTLTLGQCISTNVHSSLRWTSECSVSECDCSFFVTFYISQLFKIMDFSLI